jgi:TetR/AcrR family transcriptional regulator
MSSRTRARDATTTRQTILDAAEELFARDGYAGARVDDIARAAGYNKSLLFQYFGDKQGLYFAVVQRVRTRSDLAFRQAINTDAILEQPLNAQMLRDTLRASITWVFDHFLEHPNYCKVFTWEMALEWQVFKDASQEPLEPSFQFGLEMLRRAQTAGLLRDDVNPETIISNILNLPMITLATLPRFAQLRGNSRLEDARVVDGLREQTVRFILHAALPD